MAETKKYTVNRAMHGDGRDYVRGDTRSLTEADAAVLIESGALSEPGQEPIEREPNVKHTFGTAPSAVNEHGYTSATGEGITLPRTAEVKKPAAKPKA